MTLDEFREEMNSYRLAADVEATAAKDSMDVPRRLSSLYKKFDEDERKLANEVIGEWLSSDEESWRYDAEYLIHEFEILSTLPALKTLADRLGHSSAPGAPFEITKIQRIIARLSGVGT